MLSSVLLAATLAMAPTRDTLVSPTVVADSFEVAQTNRVVLDIDAPVEFVWRYLPGVRTRPGGERIALNGAAEGEGARFDMIVRDGSRTVTRHDRIEVLHWEPAVRFAAYITYMPPWPSLQLFYSVDLTPLSGGRTRLVMDVYGKFRLADPGTDDGRRAAVIADRRRTQEQTEQGYRALKAEIEAAAKR